MASSCRVGIPLQSAMGKHVSLHLGVLELCRLLHGDPVVCTCNVCSWDSCLLISLYLFSFAVHVAAGFATLRCHSQMDIGASYFVAFFSFVPSIASVPIHCHIFFQWCSCPFFFLCSVLFLCLLLVLLHFLFDMVFNFQRMYWCMCWFVLLKVQLVVFLCHHCSGVAPAWCKSSPGYVSRITTLAPC